MEEITPRRIVKQSAMVLFTNDLSDEKINKITSELTQSKNLQSFIHEMEEMILSEKKTR